MNNKLKLAFYDLHHWYGDRSFSLIVNNVEFDVQVLDMSTRPKGFDLYVFCDELIWTKLPFFVPKNKRVGLMKESPMHFQKHTAEDVATTFNTIFTHDVNYIAYGDPYVRLEYSSNWVGRDPRWPIDNEKSQNISFMGNVTQQTNSGYLFRKEVSEFVAKIKDVSLFGKGINPIEYKTEALVSFRYSIVMENVKQDYYFSEKIIDCFLTKTIPIYWGCPSIGQIFEEDGIITFDSLDDLKNILPTLSRDDYYQRVESINSNYEICQQKRLDSFDSYLYRLFDKLNHLHFDSRRKFSIGESKIAAGIRYLWRQ